VAQVVECLPSKCEVLSSNSIPIKKEKKKKENKREKKRKKKRIFFLSFFGARA
jgi:hypothetical protein